MEEKFKDTDLPFMYLTSAYDLEPNINPEDKSFQTIPVLMINF
jgi:hypothetical protein